MISPKDVIAEVCAARHIPIKELLGDARHDDVVQARKEIATRLAIAGHNINRIASELNRDRTTILYYMGIKDGGIVKLRVRFRKPGVLDRYRPKKSGAKYLVPYAGADMKEYEWKERRST